MLVACKNNPCKNGQKQIFDLRFVQQKSLSPSFSSSTGLFLLFDYVSKLLCARTLLSSD